ncbi:MAG: insulinase family protein [Clostridium sp.]|nr:insulinase family protein [Clostridium sp.]
MIKHAIPYIIAAILFPLAALSSSTKLELDSAILYGKLPCGLTYYILQCPRPAYKADFYLLANIGSTVEETNQLGYAHMVEHLAFCGSEHFPSGSLVDDLQKRGLSFGYDINASTSHDATIFNICNVDTRLGEGLVDTCLLALKDIACSLSFEPEMVEREKMVILEEWRQDNGPFTRLVDKMFPVLFGQESRYNHMPIGSPADFTSATPAKLRAFYEKWYQPQHQAIIVVGSIDPVDIEKKIKELWADVPAPAEPSTRIWEQIPDHKELIAGVVTDPQFPGCQMDLWFKVDIPPRDERDRVSYINSSFIGFMAQKALSQRLGDILYEKDSPFTSANTDFSQYYLADSKDGFRLYALFDRNKRIKALSRLIAEIKRIVEYGITKEEMALNLRAMRSIVESIPVKFDEYNNYEQFNRISEHFLKGNIVLSEADEVKAYSNFIDTVRPEHINAFVRKNLTRDNLAAMLVEKEVDGGDTPSPEEFSRMISDIWDTTAVRPYAMDTSYMRPILSKKLKPGKIRDFQYDSLLFAKHYALRNGARVAVCIRDVLTDEVALRAVQRGGQSALLPINFADGTFAADMAELGGVADFSSIDLRRKYDGTGIDLSVTFTPYAEIIEGTSRVSELEELMALLHARLTTVRADTAAFNNWLAIRKGMLNDFGNTPEKVFSDSIRSILYLDQRPLMRQIGKCDLDTLDYANSLELFRQRIADPANFDFIIVGNFEFETVEPLIEKYIGSLPPAKEEPKRYPPFGRLAADGERHVRFSMPSQSEGTKAYMAYELHRPYSMQDEMTLAILASIIEKQCIESLRKDAGGTYTPRVDTTSGEADGFHSLFISFDTNAEMAQGLVDDAQALIRDIAENGVDPDLFKMVKDYETKLEYSATLQQAYPMTLLTHTALYGDIDPALRFPCARAVTQEMIRQMAADLVSAPVRVTLIMDQTPIPD